MKLYHFLSKLASGMVLPALIPKDERMNIINDGESTIITLDTDNVYSNT